MYPHGLLPSETAIFDNFMSYKNRLDGIFFRNVVNSVVQGGVFADNRNQADMDRSDTILLNATRIIGSTDRYREIVDAQGVKAYHQDRIVGLELHPFARNPSKKGLTVKNIVFEGFHETSVSEHTALVEIDRDGDDPWTGNFNYWTTFEGVTIKNSDFPFLFDFNQALNNLFNGVYLVDLDSSMKPPSSKATGTSTVIADSPEVKAFVDMDRCTSFKDRGYLYCEDTCLRSVTFAVDPGQIDDLVLRIQTIPGNQEYDYKGGRDIFINENVERHERAMTDVGFLRYFTAPLPRGQYKAMFINNSTGANHWPTFVETLFEPSLCEDSFDTSDVELEIPPLEEEECEQLIRNGDMEQFPSSAPQWLQYGSMLQLAPGRGRMGSNAITEIDQHSPYAALGQYVDVRCLTIGEAYRIQAWVYLEEDGHAISCDDGSSSCPRLRLRMMTQEDNTGTSFAESVVAVATSFARPFVENGWNLMEGIVTVDATLAEATRVVVYVDRRPQGKTLFLDDVSMTKIDRDCSELVFNGNFSENSTAFWDHEQGALDLVSTNGVSSALVHFDRRNAFSAVTQRITTGCMTEGDRYLATAKVQVLNSDGTQYECNPARVSGESACPRMKLRAYFNYGHSDQTSFPHPFGFIASTDYGLTNDGWMTISDVFSATKEDELADQSVLFIDGPGKDMIVMIDEISVSPLDMNCEQLILNGDGEWGETARFWRSTSKSEVTKIRVSKSNENNVLQLVNREYPMDGLYQRVDGRCLAMGSKWKVSAQMKLWSRSKESFVACDPSRTSVAEAGCPSVRLSSVSPTEERFEERFFMTATNATWVPDEFNNFESVVAISDDMALGSNFLFGFRGFDSDWDLFVDNITMTPILV